MLTVSSSHLTISTLSLFAPFSIENICPFNEGIMHSLGESCFIPRLKSPVRNNGIYMTSVSLDPLARYHKQDLPFILGY